MAKDDVKPSPTPNAPQTFTALEFHQGESLEDRGVALKIFVLPESDPKSTNVTSVLDIRKVTGGFEVDYIGTKVENRNVLHGKKTSVRRTTFFPFGTVRHASVKVD